MTIMLSRLGERLQVSSAVTCLYIPNKHMHLQLWSFMSRKKVKVNFRAYIPHCRSHQLGTLLSLCWTLIQLLWWMAFYTLTNWKVLIKASSWNKCPFKFLRGIKDWVQGFWGYIMAKFESILWQMKKLKLFSVVTCSPTLIVYYDISLGHAHKQLGCTKPLPQGISVQ